MSDLIAEARRCAPGDDATQLAVMVHRLADRLEAAERERDAFERNSRGLETSLAGQNELLRVNLKTLAAAEAQVQEEKARAEAAEAKIARIKEAVSGHPECDRYDEDDVISCGWKSAYASVVRALQESEGK